MPHSSSDSHLVRTLNLHRQRVGAALALVCTWASWSVSAESPLKAGDTWVVAGGKAAAAKIRAVAQPKKLHLEFAQAN